MEELGANGFGKRTYIYSGFNACPLRSFIYDQLSQLFGLTIKDGTKRKIEVKEVDYSPRK
ncbi:hypothetical protein GTN66_02625 [bacterium]|nr:hypothetical protein [bacterium]NIO21946.1 hypothetical protein [Candidatus Aenigmarchaeota archaeon]NIO73299.1 hypothetical protein [bacterium]